ncbi:hypothetical protein [Paraburkholderia nemoris]|uniref:TnsA endonuclease N-terminal domain-containing protein n=1 Tax=Paraburkholderia nemoris TaxID=2793076 RepID=A0ABM8S2X6_9BURK|nr:MULTISPECIES: hypothetical protein [Paraburkholderia]KPD19630.1 hypothetical protein ADM96_04015 [Burkholderia sp. ST111]MBK3812594.1 hypothetical protein [Paraburkholderia aspalathi]CAE6706324.1 hypothetical protein R75777_00921 [Paraburkholderia nemoris]CAE6785897.1 hypothetical protein R69776_04540 [Paraburkholderia nemoris]
MKQNRLKPKITSPVKVHRAHDSIVSTEMGFDRLTLWTDHPAPDTPSRALQQHCRKLVVKSGRSLQFNPAWQTEIKIFQPGRQALVELQAALGPRCRTLVRYAEPAIDWTASDYDDAEVLYYFILEHLRVPYMRQPVKFKEGTAYYARRASRDGTKTGTNVVMYADRPSKLWAARRLALPCCHLEYRLQGVETLVQHGLLTLSDAIDFPHQAFWGENLRLFSLPKKVELGYHLAPDNANVSGTALTKRANRLLDRYRHGEAIVLQDCCRELPIVGSLVTSVDNAPFIGGVTS